MAGQRNSMLNPAGNLVRVLVGPKQREFAVHHKLLYGLCDFFRESLDAIPAALAPKHATKGPDAASGSPSPTTTALWLSSECPETFELFATWLYHQDSFLAIVNDAIIGKATLTQFRGIPHIHDRNSYRHLQWRLVRLHIFAAQVGLPVLQDLAMDAVQDLYLRCDWDISPSVIRFLYTEPEREPSRRIRKWAVAMVAWLVSNAPGPDTQAVSDIHSLFAEYPELFQDYVTHTEKTAACRANIRIKNPQLRIPGNDLRGEERHFGFRQCSFHSHRKAVGQGVCPHLQRQQQRQQEERQQQPVVSNPRISVLDKRMSRLFEANKVLDYFKTFANHGTSSRTLEPPAPRPIRTSSSLPRMSRFAGLPCT